MLFNLAAYSRGSFSIGQACLCVIENQGPSGTGAPRAHTREDLAENHRAECCGRVRAVPLPAPPCPERRRCRAFLGQPLPRAWACGRPRGNLALPRHKSKHAKEHPAVRHEPLRPCPQFPKPEWTGRFCLRTMIEAGGLLSREAKNTSYESREVLRCVLTSARSVRDTNSL